MVNTPHGWEFPTTRLSGHGDNEDGGVAVSQWGKHEAGHWERRCGDFEFRVLQNLTDGAWTWCIWMQPTGGIVASGGAKAKKAAMRDADCAYATIVEAASAKVEPRSAEAADVTHGRERPAREFVEENGHFRFRDARFDGWLRYYKDDGVWSWWVMDKAGHRALGHGESGTKEGAILAFEAVLDVPQGRGWSVFEGKFYARRVGHLESRVVPESRANRYAWWVYDHAKGKTVAQGSAESAALAKASAESAEVSLYEEADGVKAKARSSRPRQPPRQPAGPRAPGLGVLPGLPTMTEWGRVAATDEVEDKARSDMGLPPRTVRPSPTVDADAAFDAIAEAVRMAQQWHKRGDAHMASAMANLIGLMLASVCGRREDEGV